MNTDYLSVGLGALAAVIFGLVIFISGIIQEDSQVILAMFAPLPVALAVTFIVRGIFGGRNK